MRRAVVEEVAVEVDVVLVDAPRPGEAPRVDGVDEHQRDVVGQALRQAAAQQEGLDAGAAEALDAVRAGGDEQDARAPRGAPKRTTSRKSGSPSGPGSGWRCETTAPPASAQACRKAAARGGVGGGEAVRGSRARSSDSPSAVVGRAAAADRAQHADARRCGRRRRSSGLALSTTRSARLPAASVPFSCFLELQVGGVAGEQVAAPAAASAPCSGSKPSRVTQHWMACRTSVDSTGASEAPPTTTPASTSARSG